MARNVADVHLVDEKGAVIEKNEVTP